MTGLEHAEGFISFYWDYKKGRLLLEISELDQEFLYLRALATGVGSVDVRTLDRGTIAESALVTFRKTGPKVLLVHKNLAFRSTADNPALAQSVQESFAESVLVAFTVEAENEGRLLVDATNFFLRDTTEVASSIKDAELGDFKLDEERSVFYLPHTKAFPRNTEIEVLLTLSGENVSDKLRPLLPDGRTLSVRQHHSFVALPEDGFRPRKLDPRVGFGRLSFKDYGANFNETTETQWIRRWRLEKKNPNEPVSEPVQPIVYYLDRGIPEPIRSAMREGALWWNVAFEKAGFKNAFQVRDLPENADPMDVRYSVIQWVHRVERGWSIGSHYDDPRTGEIICGKARMDSHRVRTMHNYWAAMVQPVEDDNCELGLDPLAELAFTLGTIEDEESLMLRRQALLTAHEVGHTLGFPHNFSASLYDRGSVMEYVTPRIKIETDGTIDFTDAYQYGLGSWDILAVRFAYSPSPLGKEKEHLEAIAKEGLEKGILFLPESDPRWNTYDDGTDPVSWLRETLATRGALMKRYGPHLLREGQPVSDLDHYFSVIYYFHRFAIEAAAKYIGGMEHTNALFGDGQIPTSIIDSSRQREALNLLLDCLEPENLDISEEVLVHLPPPPFGRSKNFDASTTRAGYAFDQLSAARSLAFLVLDNGLEREKLARVVAFAVRQSEEILVDLPPPVAKIQSEPLTLGEVLDTMISRTWKQPLESQPRHAALRRVVQRAFLDRLLNLATDSQVTPEVKSWLHYELQNLQRILDQSQGANAEEQVHRAKARHDITHFLERPRDWTLQTTSGIIPPPGAPV
ncbi:DUF5117 domain-containing protein [SAR202 cluster bacterium AC-409-J13_OGT_754m]|nr:DUF5117 domain-containing protein [SAR202 cluster bacterium AC-409-J13_OGT_754m]